MTTFNAFLRGEDHTEFAVSIEASDISEARDIVEDHYPEADVLEVYDPEQRALDVYDRAQSMYDDPYSFDNYDWC